MPESTYSVYLVQRHGDQGGKREVTSPVKGHRLDFYDTGVWLDHETGRNFFPYEQIRTIREHSDGDGEHEAREVGSVAEPEAESEPEAGSDRTETVEGDTGAEEDMLEE